MVSVGGVAVRDQAGVITPERVHTRTSFPGISLPTPLPTRTQLTLFLPQAPGALLETHRRRLDPVQAGLIAAHVTLCREDEIGHLDPDTLRHRVSTWPAATLNLAFGSPRRFDGHGLLLPCIDGSQDFDRLRKHLLQDPGARIHQAHLTLAHPRNPVSPGNTDEASAFLPASLEVAFDDVALILQEGRSPWRTVWRVRLGGE